MQYLNIALIAVLGAFSSQAMAFSVWGRPTDDFVCDFSPWTSSKLTQKTNVPDGISDEEAIYVRLALRVAASNCKDGQVLILHSALGSDFDSRIFYVGESFVPCRRRERENRPIRDRQTFEVKPIAKMA